MKTDQVLKEWNAVIEALGSGKQSIMLRVYNTYKKTLLLYPTWNYLNNDKFLDGFKKEFKEFIDDNSIKENHIFIKYYANIVDVFKSKLSSINKISDNYVWTEDHIKSYLNGRDPYLWLLRVYELENPVIVSQVPGQIYGRLTNRIDLSNSKPVISDILFKEIAEEIRKIK